jgi:HrpA-like RNA helicase
VVKVEGRTFPINIYHTMEPQSDYISSVVKTVVQVLLFEDLGDILVFLTGQEEIEDCMHQLTQKLKLYDR